MNYSEAISNKRLLIYYSILVLIFALWTKPETFPPTPLRIGYIVAMVAPLFKNRSFLPFVIVCFGVLATGSTGFSYLPNNPHFFFFLTLIWVFIGGIVNKSQNNVVLLLLAYVTLINFVTSLELLDVSISMACVCLLFSILSPADESNHKLFSLAFASASLVLSIHFVFVSDLSTVVYNTVGGSDGLTEQTGWKDPNYFGMIIGMGLVASLLELKYFKYSLTYKIFFISVILLSMVAVIMTASRGAALSVIVAFLLFFAQSNFKHWQKVLVILCLAAFIFYIYTKGYLDLLILRSSMENSNGDITSNRTTIWLGRINNFFGEFSPISWLFGLGSYGGTHLSIAPGKSFMPNSVGFHNDYVAFLIDYGLIGLSLFLYAIIYPVKVVWKNRKCRLYIIILVLYLAIGCVTLEPLSMGSLAFFLFTLYIYSTAEMFSRESLTIDDNSDSR